MPLLKPKTRPDLTVVELDGEAIVYDDQVRKVHHLNPTATIVFNLCDGQSTISDLSGEIAEAFNLDHGEIERQVRVLLRQFRKENFLQGSRPDGVGASSNGGKSSQSGPKRKPTRAVARRESDERAKR